jgi:hypothetical protein
VLCGHQNDFNERLNARTVGHIDRSLLLAKTSQDVNDRCRRRHAPVTVISRARRYNRYNTCSALSPVYRPSGVCCKNKHVVPAAVLLYFLLNLIRFGLRPVFWYFESRPGLAPRSVHVGFVVDKMALGQVFSESFGFPPSVSFHRCSIFTHISSGWWTMGPLETQFHRDIVSPHHNSNNNNKPT